jgi:hypothetical protein
MADLASTNVTLTRLAKHRVGLLKQRVYQLAFGDGALTYPTGGVPLPPLSQFELSSVVFFALRPVTIDGLTYKYDKANHKVRIFQSAAVPAHTHDIKLIGGITATEPVAVQSGDTLGKNAATDRTIAGANYATKGGVVTLAAVAAAPLVELGNVAVAATVLLLKLEG